MRAAPYLALAGLALVLAGWGSYFAMLRVLAKNGENALRLFFRAHYGVYGKYRALAREGKARALFYWTTFLQLPGLVLLLVAAAMAL